MTESAVHSIDTTSTSTPDYTAMFAELGATFRSGRTRDLAWREAQLIALEKMMVDHETDILDALREDLGKPALEAWLAEISYVAEDAAYCRKRLKRWTKARRVSTPSTALPARAAEDSSRRR